jgi:hypothetical protein
VQYRTATMELWRRKSKWLEIWPSRGFNQLAAPDPTFITSSTGQQVPNAATKKKVRLPILENGERPSEAKFLDKNGKWIQDPTPDQIVLITSQLYPAINFAGYFPIK